MEEILINFGVSYTMSKFIPFVFTLLIGVILLLILRKKIKNKVLRICILTLSLLAPSAIYFAFKPIYQGDLNNKTRIVNADQAKELKEHTLYVISLPGCPWCKLTIEDFKKVKKQHPELDICYLVTSRDSVHMNFYKDIMPEEFTLKLADDPEKLMELSNHEFPTFAVKNNKNEILLWSNSEFGSNALDQIVKLAN